MASLSMRDCLVYPYSNFKERIKATKDMEREIKIRFGRKKKFTIIDLGVAVMAEYKSENQFH